MFWRFATYGFFKNLRLFEPFLILFFLEQGLSFLQIGILYAVREISTNVLDVPTGVFADSVGRRITMVLSMLVYILSFLIFTLFSSFWPFAIAMFLYGLGDALRSGTHKALILAYLRKKGWEQFKVEYYGGTRSWSQRGSALNVILAAAIVFWTQTYRWIFAVSVLPYLINLLNLATYPPDLDEVVRRKSTGMKPSFLIRRHYLKGLLNSSLFMGLFKGSKDYLQPILRSLALSLPILFSLNEDRRTAMVVGLIYGMLYLLTSYASENAYRLKNALRGREDTAMNLTYILGSLLVILTGGFFHLHLISLSVITFVCLYLIQNVRRPITLSYISSVVPEEKLATALSVESSARTLYAAILSPLLGFLSDFLGVGLGLSTVGLVTILLLPLVWVREPVGSTR
ncbi:MAG: MFS transporter [Thermotogae bacterium]|nr:MFS transporter [Thermotogota bacterium]